MPQGKKKLIHPTMDAMLTEALRGLQYHHKQIGNQIGELLKLGNGKTGETAQAARRGRPPKNAVTSKLAPVKERPAKRELSPAARKRIAAAQKKRWAAFHEAKAAKAGARKTKSAAA